MSDKQPGDAEDFLDAFDRKLKDFFDDSVDGEAFGADSAQVEFPPETAATRHESIDLELGDFFGDIDDKEDLVSGAAENAAPPAGVPEAEEKPLPAYAADAPVVSPPDSEAAVSTAEALTDETALEVKQAAAAATAQEVGEISSPALTAADAPTDAPAEETALPEDAPEAATPAGEPAADPITSAPADLPAAAAERENARGPSGGIGNPAPPPSPGKKKEGRSRVMVWGAAAAVVIGAAAYLATSTPEKQVPVPTETAAVSQKVSPSPAPAAVQKAPAPSVSQPPAVQAAPPPPVANWAPDARVASQQPAPVAHAPSAPMAAAAPKPAPAPPARADAYVAGSYPYTIHLSSFKTPEIAKKEAASEQERGLRVYPVRIDLGEKGIWYRLYYGFFKNADAAATAIAEDHLSKVVVRQTRYACLVGSYASAAEADAASMRLAEKGFFPYAINLGDTHHVLVGAYYNLTSAEAQSKDLSGSGVASKIIKR